jgi:CRISPR/Cas system CSM-associated protein Csm2 small subunit
MSSEEISEVTVQFSAKQLALIQSSWQTEDGWDMPDREDRKRTFQMFAKALQVEDKIEEMLQQASQEYQQQRRPDPRPQQNWLHERWREGLHEQIVNFIRGLGGVPCGKTAVYLAEAIALAGVMENLTKTQMKELHADVETLVTRILPPEDAPREQLMLLKPKLYRAASRHKELVPCKDALVACLDLLEGQNFPDEEIKHFAQFVQAIREFFEFYEAVKP